MSNYDDDDKNFELRPIWPLFSSKNMIQWYMSKHNLGSIGSQKCKICTQKFA